MFLKNINCASRYLQCRLTDALVGLQQYVLGVSSTFSARFQLVFKGRQNYLIWTTSLWETLSMRWSNHIILTASQFARPIMKPLLINLMIYHFVEYHFKKEYNNFILSSLLTILPVLRSCDFMCSCKWSTVNWVCPASINLGTSCPDGVLLRGLFKPEALFAALSDDTE